MRNIRLLVAYQGTHYCGWQSQKDQPTIQDAIEAALEKIVGHRCTLIGSGRTDSGVHALGQVANFKTTSTITTDALGRALNSLLAADIRILRVAQAPADFHARFDARAKLYRYQIYSGKVLSPFLAPFWHHVPQSLDWGAMLRAARHFVGQHDFSAMAAAATTAQDKRRRILQSVLTRRGHRIVYRIQADGFLHHMVRNIAGTLLDVGFGNLRPADIPAILKSRDRRRAGPTAAARGLFLVAVKY